MTLTLSPETEALIRKHIDAGEFATPDQLIQSALLRYEHLEDADVWMLNNAEAINAKISLSSEQIEQGKSHTAEESMKLLLERIAARTK